MTRTLGVALAVPPVLVAGSLLLWLAGLQPDWLTACWHHACAQAPARALVLDAGPMPLCARCTGMWIGGVAGAVIAAGTSSAATERFPAVWWWALAGTLITFGDGLGSVLGTWDLPAGERVVSGAILGACGSYLASAVAQTIGVHLVALGRDRRRG